MCRHLIAICFGVEDMAQDQREHGVAGFERFEEEERLWLLNVLDYFREIDKKTDSQRAAIALAVNNLLSYLGEKTSLTVRIPE